MTNIFDAIEDNDLEQLKKAINEGADINAARDDGATPLYVAAKNGHSEVVQHLLAKGGIDVNEADNDGVTPLYAAAQEGHSEVVKHLLAKEDIDVNKADNDGDTPLYIAAQNGHLDVVKYLLAKEDIDVNKADYELATPLYAAAYNGHLNVIERLVENGADVNKADTNGTTPLYAAAQEGHVNIGAILLIHGANFDNVNSTFYKEAINHIAQGIIDYDEYRLKKLAFAMGNHRKLGEKSVVRATNNDIIKTILDLLDAPRKITFEDLPEKLHCPVQLGINELQQGKVAPDSNVAANGVTSILPSGLQQENGAQR